MTYNSNKNKNHWSELEDFYQSQLNETKMNGHSIKMYLGLGVVFVTAVIPFFHGGMTPAEIFTAIIAGLVAVEHGIGGNTATPTA